MIITFPLLGLKLWYTVGYLTAPHTDTDIVFSFCVYTHAVLAHNENISTNASTIQSTPLSLFDLVSTS